MAKVGFVGMGVMGAPMAGHLLAAGHEVTVWNRSPGKTDSLKEKGARVAADLKELATNSDVVCLCVKGSEDVHICVEVLLPHLKPGSLVIDHSTIAPDAATAIAQMVEASGSNFVDAPVTGGSMGAQKGQLTIFLGGTEDATERAKPIVAAYAKRAERVGPSGSGQKMKLVNQIAVAGSVLALCECLAFGKKSGLEIEQILTLVGSGAGGSWSFENYGPKLLNDDYSPGFSVLNQRKDLAYCLDSASKIGATLPGTELADRLLAILEAEGDGNLATIALYKQFLEGARPE